MGGERHPGEWQFGASTVAFGVVTLSEGKALVEALVEAFAKAFAQAERATASPRLTESNGQATRQSDPDPFGFTDPNGSPNVPAWHATESDSDRDAKGRRIPVAEPDRSPKAAAVAVNIAVAEPDPEGTVVVRSTSSASAGRRSIAKPRRGVDSPEPNRGAGRGPVSDRDLERDAGSADGRAHRLGRAGHGKWRAPTDSDRCTDAGPE